MRSRVPVIVVVVLLVLAACGEAETGETSTTRPASTTTGQPTTTEQPTTTATTQSPATTTSSTIPGEIIEIGPVEGDVLMVIGVGHDDVLNLRALPGVEYDIVGKLAPDYMNMIARGVTRQVPDALWVAVTADGTDGWVNMRYIGYEGPTDDLTHVVVEQIGYPTADTMTELGLVVAAVFASEDPESEIVVVVAETVGDLGEVTYDIIGLGDDAVRGLRAHVFGEPGSVGFSLKSAEVTTICARGITPDGVCP
jgi:hypothetical protein